MRGRPGRMPFTSPRREANRLAAAALSGFLIVAAGFGARAYSQQTADGPPPQGEPPVQSEPDDPRGREQRVLRQVIFHDRQTEATLDRAQAALRAGDVARAVEWVQQVLDQSGDHFVWSENQRRLVSARHQARDLLGAADSQIHRFYERANEAAAVRLLERGRSRGDALLVGEVARRFFHTPSGFEATDWLATRWLDRGEYALAARAWASLAADPHHRRRMGEAVRRKAEVAERLGLRRTDEAPVRANLRSDVRTADVGILDDRADDEAELTSVVTQVAGKPDPGNLRMLAGGGQTPQSFLPYMKPAWRIALAGDQAAEFERPLRDWEIQQQREDKRAIAVHSAVSVGSAVVFRTYDGICAVDAATGRTLWNYAALTSFARVAASIEPTHTSSSEAAATRAHAVETRWSSYASNSILGTLTTDGLRVLAVDSVDIRPRQWSSDDSNEGNPSADRISRSANRLIALDVAAPRRDGRGAVKPVWSVGGSARTANWFYRMDANDDGRVTKSEFLGSPEEFRTLDRNNDGAIDKSEAESPALRLGQDPLEGHFFLGPPLPLDGRLYAVTESDGRLNLVSLEADTGAVMWIQGIGYVDRPIDEDATRAALACTPRFAGGIIVCPTQAGIVVGVDALDGALLWTYYCGDEDVSGPDGWTSSSHRSIGNAGFRHDMLIEGNRLVLLPRQSESIHCVDLSSGERLWKKPRRDGEFVAAAADGVVMIAGERLCCGLSLANGSERWSARIGEISGCGVRVGTQYLLPLSDNRIAAVDIRTGRCCGTSSPMSSGWELADEFSDEIDAGPHKPTDATSQTDDGNAVSAAPEAATATRPVARLMASAGLDRAPGNLVAAGSNFISVGTREVVAYPRAETLLKEVKQRLLDGSDSAEDLLLAAELELSLGRVAESKWELSRLRSERLSERDRMQAEHLARAVLYRDLADSPDESPAILAELERLSRTPVQRARLLQARAASEVRLGNLGGALGASRAFAELGLRSSLPSPADPTLLLSTRSWLAAVDDGLRRRFDEATLTVAANQIESQARLVLETGDRRSLERFLAANGRWPAADAVRVRLAELAAQAGELQRAELLLLENLQSARPQTKRTATLALVRLWDQAGLADEAAALLADTDWPTPPPLAELGEHSLTRLAYRRLCEAQRPFGRAHIRQTMWERCDHELAETSANSPRAFIMRPTSTFQLIDANSSIHSEISIVDRVAGRIAGSIRVPQQYTGSSVAFLSQVGHFLPLGSKTALHGISVLENNPKSGPLWTTSPLSMAYDGDAAYVGPCGPTFCVFQSHRHLVVVDPATGTPLWQRTDLDPKSGLAGDPYRGIFGDEEVLVVLAEDHLGYTLFRTATGEELRQGRLPNDARQSQERRTFGRRLLFFVSDGTTRHMRIWDPLTDRLLYDRPISDRQLFKDMGDEEIAVVTADDDLEIVDGRTGEVRAKVELGSDELANTSQLAAFADSNTYYVNLQPIHGVAEKQRYHYWFGTELFLPRIDIRGGLLAIERQSGRVLWRRTFPQRTVARPPGLRLPVLIMLSMVGDHTNGNHRSMLVEAVDAKTGQTLGLEDNQYQNRILRVTYEHERRRVRLWGARSVVDLDFEDPARSSLDDLAERNDAGRTSAPAAPVR